MTAALCPHNHGPSSGSGWCLWCDAMNISSNLSWWFHLLPTTPSDRRLRDFEIAMKQSRYDMMKDPSIETSFGSEICLLSLMFVCCAGDHLAPWQYHHQHRPGSGIPLLARALSRWSRNDSDDCSGASAAWSGPRLGTSRSSTSPSRSPSTRCSSEDSSPLPSNVMISVRAVRTSLPGSVSQFLHQLTQYLKKASSQCSQYAKKMSSQDFLCFIHTSIPDCWLRRRNLIFHLKNFLQPERGRRSKSCRSRIPGDAACLLPEHDLPGKWRKVTMSKV